jgi:hypothetical protein
MYIIEFQEKWVKREGKLSFCKVLKDEKAEDEVSVLLDQYVNDVSELISMKLKTLQDKYTITPTEIKRIKELIEELRSAEQMRHKE